MSNTNNDEYVVGIDLGTTNSCVSVWKNNKIIIIPDNNGKKTTPSMVFIPNSTDKIVGYSAKKNLEKHPKNVFYETKRVIGRKYNDIGVKDDLEIYNFNYKNDKDDNILFYTKNEANFYYPEQIASFILIKMKKIAENYLKKKVKKAVVTVPAYFNEVQRQATKDAMKLAKLECLRIINEPTAASLAYGLNNKKYMVKTTDNEFVEKTEAKVLVYDLGGGTLDVTLLTISEGTFNVKSTEGNCRLGGRDFDIAILEYVKTKFIQHYSKKYKLNEKYLRKNNDKLKLYIENAKIMLSDRMVANIHIKNYYYDIENDIKLDFNYSLTRDEFEKVCKDLFIEAIRPVDNIFFESDFKIEDVDDIVLVGGATRMPKIQFMLYNYFGKEPIVGYNPDHIVAAGASMEAFMLQNPDSMLSKNIVLNDVIPLSLGIETATGLISQIIRRNTPIPTYKIKKYTTSEDNMKDIIINIYEGERKIAKENYFVGSFTLKLDKEYKKDHATIKVTMEVDANGIINVSAKDQQSSMSNSIKIEAKHNKLSDEVIERLIIEGEKYEKYDSIKEQISLSYYKFINTYNMLKYNLTSNPYTSMEKEEKDNIVNEIETISEFIENSVKNYKKSLKLYKNKDERDEYEKDNNDVIVSEDSDKVVSVDDEQSDKKIALETIRLEKINKSLRIKNKHLSKKYPALVMMMNNDNIDIVDKIKTANADNDINNDKNDFDTLDDNGKEKIIDDNKEQLLTEQIKKLRLNKDGDIPERKHVFKICNGVGTYLATNGHTLLPEYRAQIIKYIENVNIWLNVNETIAVKAYVYKSSEINKTVSELIRENGKEIKLRSQNYKAELVELVNSLVKQLDDDILPLDYICKQVLGRKLTNIKKWYENYSPVLRKYDVQYKNKIDEINEACEDLYNKTQEHLEAFIEESKQKE